MSMYEHLDRDDPFNTAASVTLDGGQQAVITIEPEDRISQFFLRMLAVSKRTQTTYEVEVDSTPVYEEAAIPPTDIDDAVDTFTPPVTFDDQVEIRIKNVSSSTTKTYRVQAAGWERRRLSTESEGVPW